MFNGFETRDSVADGLSLVFNPLFDMKAGNGVYNESDLVSLVAHRDNRAMKLLYDRYVEYLSAVCARYIADDNDRKDVLQECFIRIFTSMDRFEFRGEGSLKAWMVRIVVNESLRFLKKNSNYGFIEYEDTLPDMADEPEPDGIPDDVLNGMVLSLPPGYRMVFNLYVFERKSHKEIAAMLGIGESSSASQFSRAKALLARKMKDYKERLDSGLPPGAQAGAGSGGSQAAGQAATRPEGPSPVHGGFKPFGKAVAFACPSLCGLSV